MAANVKVVAIDKIIVAGSDPENSGPVTVKLGRSVDLMAKRTPAPADGPWPNGQPTWEIVDAPSPFARGKLLPTTGGKVTFVPDAEGTWTIKAKCCDSEDTIEVNAEVGCGWVTNVSADNCYERVDSGAGTDSIPMNILGKRGADANEKVTLTIELKDGGVASKVTWVGATQDGSNPLKATVPVGDSVLKKVLVKYDGDECREIHVWPVWATITIGIDGQLNPGNKAPTLTANGEFKDKYGGGKSLGPIDKWSNAKLTYKDAGGRVEARALISPPGVGEVIPVGKLSFKRKLNSIAWFNGGHYTNGQWFAGPSDTQVNADDTSAAEFLDVNPAENDSLFDIDIPGFGVPPQYHTCEMYANFVQYVTIKACGASVQCSSDSPWSYRLRIDYDKPNNKVDLSDLKPSLIDPLPNQPFYGKR